MINIFIGTEPKTEIARKVLEHSILTQTKHRDKIQFKPMLGEDWAEKSQAAIKASGTGFSLLRWSIPERMEYKGAAIYLDADILCFGDITELYMADATYGNETTSTWCCYYKHKWFQKHVTPETSVMLIDCAKAETKQPSFQNCLDYVRKGGKDRTNYMRIMRALKHNPPPQEIPSKFNSLNDLQDDTLLLHYTIEPQQPWYNPDHKFADPWKDALRDALDDNYVSEEEVREAISNYRQHVPNKHRANGMHPEWEKLVL